MRLTGSRMYFNFFITNTNWQIGMVIEKMYINIWQLLHMVTINRISYSLPKSQYLYLRLIIIRIYSCFDKWVELTQILFNIEFTQLGSDYGKYYETFRALKKFKLIDPSKKLRIFYCYNYLS